MFCGVDKITESTSKTEDRNLTENYQTVIKLCLIMDTQGRSSSSTPVLTTFLTTSFADLSQNCPLPLFGAALSFKAIDSQVAVSEDV